MRSEADRPFPDSEGKRRQGGTQQCDKEPVRV
ncbi:protein of unknown function [Streptomyces murinus]